MSVEIKVPTLGESIVEATVGRWMKQEGEAVAVGEPLVELETDKVNMEVAATGAGVLQSIVKREGETVGIGEILALLGGDGAAASPAPTSAAPQAAPAPAAALAAAEAEEEGATGGDAGRSTPLARRIAAEHGLDINQISGTGPGGRVTRDDVNSHLAQGNNTPAPPTVVPVTPPVAAPAVAAAPPAPAASTAAGRPEERVRMSRRRQTIARRLVEAQQTAAMLTTFNEIDMTAIMEVRKRRRDAFKERNGIGLGFMSFFTKAVVGALKSFPRLNAEIQGDEMILKGYYDIGIAVGAEEGLVVPVVRDADRLSFAAIERQIAGLAEKARKNTLSLAELQGGTFTITNGGIFGSLLSTPILNTPQVGILGMHSIQQRPVAIDGQVVIRPMMYVALSYDHRIVDGSEAVRFLVRVKELAEDPESLLLEG
ncbi:MAG TPA: 2-oxoglutarate dehydrogenase complex dihydrolipoyllysine-residue succinyltransferase [Thermomicrobiales bacterium]|jgi:2-oxoglutarate dehydrogenase E2 component (dihydrolipoamide succinyltransferase)